MTVEEGVAGSVQLADSLQLITRLVNAGASYIHASLGSELDQRPATGVPDRTIVSILRDYIDGHVPLIVAGRIKTPAQAGSALNLGLSQLAVGQNLGINPDWVAHAQIGRDSDIRLTISAGDVASTCVPHKLWAVIEATPG